MKILLTGASGYIGKRLLPVLLNQKHEVICCVRDKKRFDTSSYKTNNLKVIEVNFLDKDSLRFIPDHIDAAYYLIHSMSSSYRDFERLEKISARNFKEKLESIRVRQVIYLSGIINDKALSRHLSSRKVVEDILSQGSYHLTTLRAGIIVGSGSASFEIIRDLVEKLPVMIAPKWLNTRSQPIAIRNVIEFMSKVLLKDFAFDKSFDIGGPEILTYRQMLYQFSEVRNLHRKIFVVPVMTPKLSSYWLYFITSTSYKLAVNLVNSMKIEIVCRKNYLAEQLGIKLIAYKDAIRLAFDKIEQQEVISSWIDALSSHTLEKGISSVIKVPTFGCYSDRRIREISNTDKVWERIWAIGGDQGWYYANWLWAVRGFIDKLSGGVGLRRGRKSRNQISAGDSLDFWRVLFASKKGKRLLLYAEMKLPGEAWLEFRIEEKKLIQTATFRPLGLWGRIYWYSVMPLHAFVFWGMANKISS